MQDVCDMRTQYTTWFTTSLSANSVVRAPYGRLGSHGFESHQALRWFFSSCIVKSFLAYLCASFSAPEKVSRSRAVSLVCLLDGTKTMTGFLGECFTID